MAFEPFINQWQQMFGMCSPRGVSAVFDESADGYVKSEAVSCLFLQRRRDARRVYGHILAARMGMDGNKKLGPFYPSSETQAELMQMTYREANVDPSGLTYFEAHSTGTRVGDVEEVKAIYSAYCEKRTKPLPLGAVKSNMGHSEGASGLVSITKVLIAFENQCIPPNINLNALKQELRPYFPPLLPITEKYDYIPGLYL
ncbi:unnamed protein product [Medioppia subpectinata]|uniref:Ketosynthase family 3 (KS3) domain-containing protein n=1 Tax=Medioppia subpectinata TaxID=1979941 RepID=A0A7R9L2W3_9ACAR|nr:unnamed protein product [Medioppia subpectinata]CAG2114275.1 unnamed protein product [Medioppia subpectinata]